MRTTPTFPTKTFKPAAMALAVATTLSACLGGGGGTSAPDFNAGGTGIGSNNSEISSSILRRYQERNVQRQKHALCRSG